MTTPGASPHNRTRTMPGRSARAAPPARYLSPPRRPNASLRTRPLHASAPELGTCAGAAHRS
eukprot:6978744-Pyramimonas_sp.AAC.1